MQGKPTQRGKGTASMDANDPRTLQLAIVALAHRRLTQGGGSVRLNIHKDIPDTMAFDLQVEGDDLILSVKKTEPKIELVTAGADALNHLPPASKLIGAH